MPQATSIGRADTLTAVTISAILPLPASVASNRASVLTPVEGESALVRIVRALAPAVTEVLVTSDDALIDDVRAGLAGVSARVIAAGVNASTADCLTAATGHLRTGAATHVLVADHRHPVMSRDLIDRVITALSDGAAVVVPVLPVTDTVKQVDEQGVIQSTVDRSELAITQYPYGAAVPRLGDLRTGLYAGIREGGQYFSPGAGIRHRAGAVAGGTGCPPPVTPCQRIDRVPAAGGERCRIIRLIDQPTLPRGVGICQVIVHVDLKNDIVGRR